MVRLLHTDGNGVRCDRYGTVCWFYWYRSTPPEPDDLEALAYFTSKAGAQEWLVHWMHDRGKDPQQQRRWSSAVPASWQTTEHGIRYTLKSGQGLSAGLFLDQRPNRRWVLENAAGKNVLNLFCYTAGFSLCAAQGQAVSLINVDTSKATLAWAKENFALNQLATDHTEFWAADAQFFLQRCKKRGRTFDLIICDPPSFARNTSGTFVLERDIQGLLSHIWPLLTPGGHLLFSSNYEKWNFNTFSHHISAGLARHPYQLASLPPPARDFETPEQSPILKVALVVKY